MWWNEGFYSSGEYTVLEPDKTVEFIWHGRGEPAPTQVKVSLEAEGDGTLVTLTHGGIGSGDEWESLVGEATQGWTNSGTSSGAMPTP